jgi:NAD(P)-dependent dehydrogenase (short-subunit alcohol dehydrogenase family)
MDLAGKVAIVTGGASGIGRALARRVAEASPAGVAVADLDGPGAEAVAAGLASPSLGAECDVTDEAALRALIERTEAAFGPVDVFFANAGVIGGSDEQTPEEVWDRSFSVNVRAHIVAARLLVPGWLERGAGCFVVTASAAGVLTQIGVAPYAVSKHAAVAFAEWLRASYAHRGIVVQALCPQGVRTPMLAATGDVGRVVLEPTAIEPEQVADVTVDALESGPFLVLPHPEVARYYAGRAADPDAWLAGMRRVQAKLG